MPQKPLTRVALDPGENVILEGRESPALQWIRYFISLGCYEFWRRAKIVTLTDRRLITCKGLITKSNRSLPLSKIQDVSVVTQLGFGRLAVTTAGGAGGVIQTPWMSGGIARRMGASANAALHPSPQFVATGPVLDVADQLHRLAELRDSGVLTTEEFDIQKSRILTS